MKIVSRFTDSTRRFKEFGEQVGETDTARVVAWIDLSEETSEELRSMWARTTNGEFQDAILLELGKRSAIPLDPNTPIPTQHPKENE